MKIAFDAKRVYQNATGLGNYSRTLISSLSSLFPEHHYYLCAPKITNRFDNAEFKNIQNITPKDLFSKKFPTLWRSNGIKKNLQEKNINLYHGLSNEIPAGIQKTKIRSVVTIHDLIFERYPKQYNWIDTKIYRHKFKYACKNSDHIIAISQQTKDDIINFYQISESKITVCYQSCNPAFAAILPESEKSRIRQLYHLPERFFLYIGSIIERKNLLTICKALSALKGKLNIPLAVIGEGDAYKQQVKTYIRQNNLTDQVIFLSETVPAKKSADYQSGADFPAIYQLSAGVIYPSVFEGFGLPVLEALWSKVPVITSNVSCLPETGGDAAYYVNPYAAEEIADGMLRLAADEILVSNMQEKGLIQARYFTAEKCAADIMQVYLRLL